MTDHSGKEPPDSATDAIGELWRAGRAEAIKKRRVFDAVRAQAEGLSRDGLRTLLEQELDRQRIPRDPRWVERKLDELAISPVDRAKSKAKFLAALPGLLRRMRGQPDVPPWMRRPSDASVPLWGPEREKITVQIDPAAAPWLDRALSEAPLRAAGKIATMDLWFDRTGREARLASVHLGERQIGTMEAPPDSGFAEAFTAAEQLGEKLFTTTTLSHEPHLTPPYLLVVEVPIK